MPQDPRQVRELRRKAARRRRATRTWITLAVFAIVLVAGGVSAYAWSRTRGTVNKQAVAVVQPTSTAPASQPTETAAAPAQVPATVTPEPQQGETASTGASKAVSKAACRVPRRSVGQAGQLRPAQAQAQVRRDHD